MSSFTFTQDYPIDAFYNVIRDALYEVIDFTQAPAGLVANAFLTTTSIAGQGHVDVRLPTGQERPVSLYVGTIANSGERKTAVDSLVSAPIYEHDAKTIKDHRLELADYRARKHCWNTVGEAIQQQVRKAVKRGQNASQPCSELVAHSQREPTKPVSMRMIHQNFTERALMDALRGQDRSIAIMSDEGDVVLKGGAMNQMGVLNKAWDGAKELVLDRANDHVEISNPRVTVSFMVQADVFAKFMDKKGDVARASGHLARYLVAYPASTQGMRRTSLEEPVWEALPVFHQRVAELLATSGDTERKVLSFSPEAKERWVWVQNDVERRLGFNGDLVGIRDYASKFMENTSRIAAIFHHFTSQEGTIISLETLNRALSVSNWYLEEFCRLFGDASGEPQVIADARKLLRYLFVHVWCYQCNEVPRNDVRQCGPVRKQGRFEDALDQLCREDSIWVGRVNGRKKLFIHLNPHVFNQLSFQ